jgi:protein TonB
VYQEVVDSVVIASYYVDQIRRDTIYSHAEKPAIYKGGMHDLFEDVGKDLKYPKEARKNFVRGRLLVTFKIDKTGKLYDFKVHNGIGMGCDEAAILAIQKRRTWTPAKVKGKPVIQEMTLPVAFNMQPVLMSPKREL